MAFPVLTAETCARISESRGGVVGAEGCGCVNMLLLLEAGAT